jgi:DNA (cytosine-5)-methyltransferase 1
MYRIVGAVRPRWVVGENVFGLLNWRGGMVFEQVQADLEAEGYEVWSFVLPAAGIGALHRRDRIWFIAHANRDDERGVGRDVRSQKETVGEEKHFAKPAQTIKPDDPGQWSLRYRARAWEKFPTVSPVYFGNDGIPAGLDGITFPKWRDGSIKGTGNAIVPQVAWELFKVIDQMEKRRG